MKQAKIAIIGAGNVGCSTAFALLLHDLASEIILVDTQHEKCCGEAKDLSDALPFSHTQKIYAGTYNDACKADIVIITAGRAQKPGESRDVLLQTNYGIIQSICNELKSIQPNAIVIMVTNPLDVMTFVAQQLLPLPKHQVFGTGTWLDSQRLRRFLGYRLAIAPSEIEAYMLGEHGDSQFAAFSLTKIQGRPLQEFALSSTDLSEIEEETKKEVYEIIKAKCATYYGIAACVADICKAIIYNEQRIMPLSVYDSEHNICISKLIKLGQQGISEIPAIKLTEAEQQQFEHSAHSIQNQNKQLIITKI